MVDKKTGIWYIDYRPKSINEIVLPENFPERLVKIISEKDFDNLPHLLLIGKAGTGKTSLANVIINEFKANVLSLNASDERGIDTIREKVIKYASTVSNVPKIVFLDEADQLTRDAQEILRNVMETYAKRVRFILTGNYDRFIAPIKDRCLVIQFNNLPKDKIKKRLIEILNDNNIKYREEDINRIIDIFYPSLRRMINFIQNNINEENELIIDESNFGKGIYTEVDDEILKDIFMEFVSFRNGNYKSLYQIRKMIIEKDFNEWIKLYRYFFDNLEDEMDKLIVYEFLYRHNTVADKELNFLGMILALKNRMLPYYLVDNMNTNNVYIQNKNKATQNREQKQKQNIDTNRKEDDTTTNETKRRRKYGFKWDI